MKPKYFRWMITSIILSFVLMVFAPKILAVFAALVFALPLAALILFVLALVWYAFTQDDSQTLTQTPDEAK